MTTQPQPTILCVDDEPRVLSGLQRTLGFDYHVETAESGPEGLEILARRQDVAVIVSDLNLPLMDGITFLAHARQILPHAVRILLTGDADLAAAVRAVNDGHLFRFLTKPAPPDALRAAVAAAVRQHELEVAEEVLLDQTLKGALNMLGETLAVVAPDIFGQVVRLHSLTREVLHATGSFMTWEIESAAVLMLLPYASVPEETLRRHFEGEALHEVEREMIERVPAMAAELIGGLPRMEKVQEILAHLGARFDGAGMVEGTPRGEEIPLGARVLSLIVDYLGFERVTGSSSKALVKLRKDWGRYDPRLGAALFKVARRAETIETRFVPVRELKVGMVIMQRVETKGGTGILAEGHEVTPQLLERLRNFVHGIGIKEPLRVCERS